MGLDMYLDKKIYVMPSYSRSEEGTAELVLKKGATELKIPVRAGGDFTLKQAYWRKANAIHNWFVQNAQDGIDDADSHEVSEESLKTLYDLCIKILKSRQYDTKEETFALAKQLLPTKEGFFFGDTEYNDWYLSYLEDTVNNLRKLFDTKPPENTDDFRVSTYYEYRASW